MTFTPPHVDPAARPLGRLGFMRGFVRNPLEVIPRAAYEEDFIPMGAAIGTRFWVTSPALVKAVLLDPPPYRDPDRLVVVWEHNVPRNRPTNVVATVNFHAWQRLSSSFAGLEAATRYVTERQAFGGPLVDQQGVRFMLAEMAREVAAARALTRQAAAARLR